ncbi:MAG: DNA repair protein [Lachnospiraceae bacterium]|nr:DNA repair protein [Lachnospiraceae bacterium]
MKKDARKLSRTELLEILIDQEKEIQDLKARLQAAQDELADRKIALAQTGSIAEAALRLNRVFESAQAAADQYLENVRRVSGAGSDLPKTETGAGPDEERRPKAMEENAQSSPTDDCG